MKPGLKAILNLVMAASIIIPAAAIVTTGVFSSAHQSKEITSEQVTTLGYAQSGGLEVLFSECGETLRAASLYNEIIETAEGRYADVESGVTRLFDGLVQSNPYILDIIVTEVNGVICADMRSNGVGSLFPGFEAAKNLSKQEVYISDITVSNSDYEGKNTLYAVCRINHGESFSGFISMVFSSEIFAEYLSGCDFYEYADLFITDRKGTALGFDGDVKRYDEINTPAFKELVNSVVGTQNNISSKFEKINTGGLVGCFGNISVSGGWYWYCAYPVSKISVISTQLIIITIAVAAACLVCAVFTIAVSRKVIRPLHAITGKMRNINKGDVDVRFDTGAGGEYDYISETFNQMMDEVLLSGELHKTISELSDNMLFEWDFLRETLYVSDNFINLFDIDPKQATLINGRFIDSVMDKENSEKYKVDINKLLRTKDTLSGEYQVSTRQSGAIWISVQAQCAVDRLGGLLRIVGVITNINNEKTLTLQLSERASYDFLSQLYNRSTFMRELQTEIERSVSSRVGVIFIDVDDFKFVNDRYGHSTGDEIIKCVARIIKEKLKNCGFAGRFGGDEFVMCVTEETTLENIDKLAMSLIELFDQGYYSKEHDVTLKIKASLGIAIAPDHGRESEILLAAADEAMYFVKKNGKSNYHIYDPEDSLLVDLMHSL